MWRLYTLNQWQKRSFQDFFMSRKAQCKTNVNSIFIFSPILLFFSLLIKDYERIVTIIKRLTTGFYGTKTIITYDYCYLLTGYRVVSMLNFDCVDWDFPFPHSSTINWGKYTFQPLEPQLYILPRCIYSIIKLIINWRKII